METKEKKPLLIIYKETDDDITLELSKDISFIEKMALLTFINIYRKDLEEDIRLSYVEEEE